MKFMKQRVPAADLVNGLLKKLPPLHERFAAINAASEEQLLMIERKSSTEWDFGSYTPPAEAADAPTDPQRLSEGQVDVKQVGRFTLTTERHPRRTSAEVPP
jgi:hypothetical protein